MKRHKYREALQNRTINPSPDSWEKLNERLNLHQNKDKGRSFLFLKIASVILIFISVGIYFFEPQEDIINTPVIAVPTIKEDFKNIPDVNDTKQIEVATASKNSTSQKKPLINSYTDEAISKEVAFAQPDTEGEPTVIEETEVAVIDSLTETILISEKTNAEDQIMDDEIDELLHQSKIKLIVNGQISSQKLVNADALLNSVEDDLNKSLKQKLLEKIATTLKKDREVVSSKEN